MAAKSFTEEGTLTLKEIFNDQEQLKEEVLDNAKMVIRQMNDVIRSFDAAAACWCSLEVVLHYHRQYQGNLKALLHLDELRKPLRDAPKDKRQHDEHRPPR